MRALGAWADDELVEAVLAVMNLTAGQAVTAFDVRGRKHLVMHA